MIPETDHIPEKTMQSDAGDILTVRAEGNATPADMTMAKEMSEVLLKHYPGHPWGVHASSEQGIVMIQHMELGAKHPQYENLRYYIRMTELASDPGMKSVMRGGGQLLEFFNAPRLPWRQEDMADSDPSERPAFFGMKGESA